MSENNLIDMAYEQHTGTVGIVTNGEHGTSTFSSTVIEFYGGSVTATHAFRGVSTV